jgi:hypothetical protein
LSNNSARQWPTISHTAPPHPNRQAHDMQHLDNILVFVKVAEFESISKAARALDMPISLNQCIELSRFSKEHSRIHIDLFITNAYLNLVAESRPDPP